MESTTNQLKEFAEAHCPQTLRDEVSRHPTPGVAPPPAVPATEEEIQHAAGAIRDVAHAFLKALTPTPDCPENQGNPVPEGVFRNVKDALQKLEEIAPSPITVQGAKSDAQNSTHHDKEPVTHHSKELTEAHSQQTLQEPQPFAQPPNATDPEEVDKNVGKGGTSAAEDEDVSEVGEAEVSCGIDLPTAQDCSGNVTPVPTTGELEDISEVQDQTSTATAHQAEEVVLKADPRAATPLKSLLKRQAEEVVDEEVCEEDYQDEGRYSPKKVTFSEIDQIKLMSMESLLSTATSDTSTCEGSAISGPIMSTKASGLSPYHLNNAATTPRRNQVAYQSQGKHSD